MSTTSLDLIADLILRESGVWLRPGQRSALRAAVARVAPDTAPAAFLRLAGDSAGGPGLRARLIEEITVQETSFLRDRGQLETIDWSLLRESAAAAGSRTIRVWSAACATGEEVYTLALLACEAFATPAPPVRILGTDISGAAVDRARAGSYGPRTARALDPALRDRYFDSQGDRLVVGKRLRNIVSFARHNLLHDPAPPAGEAPFDLILCRNILIYFEPETAERAVAALEGALRDPGTLVLGAPDALCVSGPRTPVSQQRPAPVPQSLRRPLGRVPEETPADRLARAVRSADRGELAEAIRESSELLVDDPLNADAYFLRGLVELEAGDAPAAVRSLRGALYIYPTFGAAAFKLGRAYEVVGDPTAARRAYQQALRTIDGEAEHHHEPILEQVDVEEIATACAARISALREPVTG